MILVRTERSDSVSTRDMGEGTGGLGAGSVGGPVGEEWEGWLVGGEGVGGVMGGCVGGSAKGGREGMWVGSPSLAVALTRPSFLPKNNNKQLSRKMLATTSIVNYQQLYKFRSV